MVSLGPKSYVFVFAKFDLVVSRGPEVPVELLSFSIYLILASSPTRKSHDN